MTSGYCVDTCTRLAEKFQQARLFRPMRVSRYDEGAELAYDVSSVAGARIGGAGRVQLLVEKFVGGGFAGQVYRVRVTKIENGPIAGLVQGGIYAMKILIPPSGFALFFRNMVYALGFQGPFQLQTNPVAARAGALWQKFFRRGARIAFGDETVVNDIHAVFVDTRLGSCGELSDWVDGRTWRLEVDDRMDCLRRWKQGRRLMPEWLGSPEYRAKKEFMEGFVKLLHNMGGHEFARQYEWSTCKSQPNCLKRHGHADGACDGLIAVDFRAGLALLPFLPMSPGDFKLIGQGLARGSLVQFDRGDLQRLETYVDEHGAQFEDMRPMLEELKVAEKKYRESVPDVTHNHVRLLYSKSLWSGILSSAVTGWRLRGFADEEGAHRLSRSRVAALVFYMLGCVPLLGKLVRRLWCHAAWRRHYAAVLTNWDYAVRALQARMAERLIPWHRDGRLDTRRALKAVESPGFFLLHAALSVMPVGLHKCLADWRYARQRLAYVFVRPVRLYFNAALREQWLRDMIRGGREKHIITGEDAGVILSQLNEPFIQKYLKSLAVHVCTLPVTQIVSVMAAFIYVGMHPEMPRAEAWGVGLGIIALFQVIPVSPGSLTRGLYVLYLVLRERNFKDYNIAVFLGFFKYIGYLAFPIQMAYRYPALARFMAVHWASEAVPIVPVFGESGALLEHGVFCLFYNWPLTLRRRIGVWAERWALMRPRYWHAACCSLAAAAVLGLGEYSYYAVSGALPGLRQLWWLVVLAPLACGATVMLGCGGAPLSRRMIAAVLSGALTGVLWTVLSVLFLGAVPGAVREFAVACVWRVFIFCILASAGAVLALLKLQDPDVKKMIMDPSDGEVLS